MYERIGFGAMTKNNISVLGEESEYLAVLDQTPPEVQRDWCELRLV